MTQEQKAKAYDRALEAVKRLREVNPSDEGIQNWVDENFPEFKESEDEKIRKELIDAIQGLWDNDALPMPLSVKRKDSWLAWLEKQGKKELENYDEAEKEKVDFVGDGFIECHADFLDFKEGETYWLEYIGDDKYNVRSDNLLGKTYHITPCQLYTVFKKLTWLEKQGQTFIKKDVDDAYLKGVADAKNEIKKQCEANYQIRKDIATFIFNYRGDIKDRAKWMDYLGIKVSFAEKQGEQKQDPCEHCDNVMLNCHNFPCIKKRAFEQGKSVFEVINEEDADNVEPTDYNTIDPHFGKPIDKVEPKFKVGDWIMLTAGELSTTLQIVKVNANKKLYWFNDCSYLPIVDEECLHLWTIKDAKDGDVLVSQYGKPFIYNGNHDSSTVGSYCGITTENRFEVATEECRWTENVNIHPATKEQRDTLLKAMADAGYTFDFKKKELRKLKFIVGDEIKSDNEEPLTITKIDENGYWSEDLFICGFDDAAKWELVGQKSAWSEEDEKMRKELMDFCIKCGKGHTIVNTQGQ